MKNLVKIFFLVILLLVPQAFSQEKFKREKISTLSKEAMEEMRLQQNLDNLTIANYQAFERTVYYFLNLKDKAIMPLVEHLKSNKNNDDVVIPTIYTLGRLGNKASKAVSVIMPFLSSPNRDIVFTTISALGKIGKASDKAVPQLYPIAYDQTDMVLNKAALIALERINTPNSMAILQEIKNIEILEKKRKEQANQEAAPQQ
ncbi:MAG TPA: hypothetical protein DIV86_04645 [Alphaproteobacteria bacterium]|nr:hypothetical protein [Alphaproteobacteria bacterium]